MSPDLEWRVEDESGQTVIVKTAPPPRRKQKIIIVCIVMAGIGWGVVWNLIASPLPATPAPPTFEATIHRQPSRVVTPVIQPTRDDWGWFSSVFVYHIPTDTLTLDPHVARDSIAHGIVQNIYDDLITYAGPDPTRFAPLLAESIPEPVVMKDGRVIYTWTITNSVKFHNGDMLTAEDVAYSFWRSMLLHGSNTSSYLLLNAFFDVDDATQLVEPSGQLISDSAALKKASTRKLQAACQRVKQAITFDNATRTVTMTLPRSWSPFLPSLAGTWAAIVDKQWQIKQGDWDGDCRTWQNFYNQPSPTRDKANGTGPYQLEHWTPGEEIALVLKEGDYSERGPWIERIVFKVVMEFGTRLAAFQAGDNNAIDLPSAADRAQLDPLVRDECSLSTGQCQLVNPDGFTRAYDGLLIPERTDAFFNFNVANDSPFINHGGLLRELIRPDFFGDAHIRRAFNYCFDWADYIQKAFLGHAAQSLALTLPGQPGYAGSPTYNFDLKLCEEEFRSSKWDVWKTGFYLQVPYAAGSINQQMAIDILARNLAKVNPGFLVAPVAMPPEMYQRLLQAGQLPIFFVNWREDIHDPHNWYAPYLLGVFASYQHLPADLQSRYKALVDQGAHETDPVKRSTIYRQLNDMLHDDALHIILANAYDKHYEPMYMKGWFGSLNQNPLVPPFYYHQFFEAAGPKPR